MRDSLCKEIPLQPCDLITGSICYQIPVLSESISTGKFLINYRQVQYNPQYHTDVQIASKGWCISSSDTTMETEVEVSLG